MFKKQSNKNNIAQTNHVSNVINGRYVCIDPKGIMLGSKQNVIKIEKGQSNHIKEERTLNIKTRQDKVSNSDILQLLIDSGSTITVCTDARFFTTYTLSSKIRVQDAGEHIHNSIGYGKIKGTVHGLSGEEQIELDAVHIPSFGLNILSTKQIRKTGYTVILPSSQSGYTCTPVGNKIIHNTYTDGLEYIEIAPATEERSYAAPAKRRKISETMIEEQERILMTPDSKKLTPFERELEASTQQELIQRIADPSLQHDNIWKQGRIQRKLINMNIYAPLHRHINDDIIMKYHCLLGHANARTVQKHAQINLAPEEYAKLSFNQKLWCDACKATKSKRKSIPKTATAPTAATLPWQHQSCDILGKWKQASYGGSFHYAFMFVCTYSNDKRIYGMKTLEDVPAVIKSHLDWCRSGYPRSQIHTECKHIPTSEASLKSDATHLLRTRQIHEIFGKYGIKYCSAQPYTQSRNGKCERNWATIKASAQAMRSAYKLPIEYWWLSIRHATYLSTILPTSANDDSISPYEKITGKKPPSVHLQIFGSAAYVNRPVVKMGEEKAVGGRYVGYYPPSKSHLILIPPTNGGCPSLKEFQNKPAGAVSPRKRQQLLESIHVDIKQDIPPSVSSGDIPLVAPGYRGYDVEDEEDTIIIGGEETPTPSEDRTTEDVLDLDYHNTHCITTPGPCTCMINDVNDAGRGSDYTQYCNHVHDHREEINIKLPSSSPHDAEHDTQSHLVHYPKVLALGGVLPSWSAAKKTTNPEHRKLFQEAKETEIQNLIDRKVIEKIKMSEVPGGTRIMPSLMNFVLKTDAHNNVKRARARWVLGGHKQIQGIHYDESAAFCPRWSTVRTLIASCARKGKTLRSADISSAYLNSPGASVLYMHSPHDQKEKDEDGQPYVWRVPGNLYGRVEAGHQWGKYFQKFLKEKGFEPSKADPCYFHREITVDGKTHTTSLVVYVDDLAYYSNTDEASTHFEQELIEKFGDIKAETPDLFLGANINQNKEGIHISHPAMIDRMAIKFFPQMDPSKVDVSTTKTPFPSHGSAMGAEVKISDCPDTENGEPKLNAPYRELVGSLSYIAVTTRPDIAFYTSQLARVQSNPGEIHFKLAKHVLRYLMATRTHGIMYRFKGNNLEYFTDASWADITPAYVIGTDGQKRILPHVADDGRRSSYGYVGYYASGPISWAARIHKGRRSLSTAESELVAANEAAKDIVHIRQVLTSMHQPETKPTTIYEDNQAVIDITMREGITARTKHIEVKWYYIRDLITDKIVNILKKHTDENVADIYTKRLSQEKFEMFRDELVQIPEQGLTFSQDAYA